MGAAVCSGNISIGYNTISYCLIVPYDLVGGDQLTYTLITLSDISVTCTVVFSTGVGGSERALTKQICSSGQRRHSNPVFLIGLT